MVGRGRPLRVAARNELRRLMKALASGAHWAPPVMKLYSALGLARKARMLSTSCGRDDNSSVRLSPPAQSFSASPWTNPALIGVTRSCFCARQASIAACWISKGKMTTCSRPCIATMMNFAVVLIDICWTAFAGAPASIEDIFDISFFLMFAVRVPPYALASPKRSQVLNQISFISSVHGA